MGRTHTLSSASHNSPNTAPAPLVPPISQAERLKMNFRRDLDGRVSLRNRQGQWFSVRPDLQVGRAGAG